MNKDKAVILLSGGLDSLVALAYVQAREPYNVELALTFDYGQKALKNEIESTEKICEFYNIQHKIIKLDWLKDITKTSLVSDKEIPKSGFSTKESAASVWIPNRNALFLNIAACYCDSFGYNYIVYGANKEEGANFPDNTETFRKEITALFKTSTLVGPKVTAPLINYTKDDIVKIGAELSVPFDLVWSCYISGDKHCGECESCSYLKKALIANHLESYKDKLFKK